MRMSWKAWIFLGPVLFVRKIILILLVVIILLSLGVYFVLNSPIVIQNIADKYAGDYNLSYEGITGSAFSGLSIQNPRYKDQSLAKSLTFLWDPNALITKHISVSKLHLKEADVDVVKMFVASLGTDKESKPVAKEDKSSFDFKVNIKDIDIDVKAFTQNGIAIKTLSLQTEALSYEEDEINVEHMVFVLESNISHIELNASLKDQVLDVENVLLDKVDTMALMAIVSGEDTKKSKPKQSHVIASKQEPASPLIPQEVSVKKLSLNLLPLVYEGIKLRDIALRGESISYDSIKQNLSKAKKLSLTAKSNLGNIAYQGGAKQNHLLGTLRFMPKDDLYTRYKIPLRKGSIKTITADFDASKSRLIADLSTKGKSILEAKKDGFNLDVDHFISHVYYQYKGNKVTADTKAIVTTPYAKAVKIDNHFFMDKNIEYNGTVKADQVKGFEQKFAKPLAHLVIGYKGTTKGVKTTFSADAIKGTFDSVNFKQAIVHLETRKPLLLNEVILLPKELAKTKLTLIADVPLDFKDFSKIPAKITLRSNVVNLDTNVVYGKGMTLKGKIRIPSGSLLKRYLPKLKWDGISSIDADISFVEEKLGLKVKSKTLNANLKHDLKGGDLRGTIDLAGLIVSVKGNTKAKLKIATKIKSMKALNKSLERIYPVEKLPPMTGAITTTLTIDALKRADLTLNAPFIEYRVNRKKRKKIKNINLVLSMDASEILLQSYALEFNKQKYFSSKTARIRLGEKIDISNLWLNDSLELTGNYDTKQQKGHFEAHAKRFVIKDKIAEIESKIDLKGTLEKEKLDIKGTVLLLKGKVKPDLNGGHSYVSDSDIIIVQEMKERTKSPFMNNLSLDIKIKSKKGLKLKQGPINIRLKPDLSITKAQGGNILYLGSVNLPRGGSYVFEDKRFVLSQSAVHFTGDVNKPTLDIRARYRTVNYLIKINVTGTPATPNLKFSSQPHLSREEILSVLLFGTEAAGGTNSGSSLMKMMGGAMAKAALSEVGVKVDHLVFGEGNSVEVGKKLSNKATVIYINGVVPKIKLKYQHGKSTESVIGVSEESSSYDIIFKKDF